MQKQRIIIFLDLNGVMFPKVSSNVKPFMNLRKLIDTYPQIKLVITSSLRLGNTDWRLHNALEEFYKEFKQSIIGETIQIKGLCYYRNVYKNKVLERTIESKSFRGLEINQWLIDNKDKLQCKVSKLEYYIIDDNIHLNWLAKQADKLILCDKTKGFDDKVFDILINKISYGKNEEKKKLINLNKEFGTTNFCRYTQEDLMKVLTEYELNIITCLKMSNVISCKTNQITDITPIKELLIQFCKDNWDTPKFVNGLNYNKFYLYKPLIKWLSNEEYFNPNNLKFDVWFQQFIDKYIKYESYE